MTLAAGCSLGLEAAAFIPPPPLAYGGPPASAHASRARSGGATFMASRRRYPRAAEQLLPERSEEHTVDEWRARLFPSRRGTLKPHIAHPELWKHASAAQLHGWTQHAHDANRALRLSEDDYRAAIAAVSGAPPYKPHGPAVSPYRR